MAAACNACGAAEADYLCSRCKVVRFCGQECFRKAWKSHKIVCRPQEQISGSSASTSWPQSQPSRLHSDDAKQRGSTPKQVQTPPPQKVEPQKIEAPVRRAIDYSKFDNLEDSDDEAYEKVNRRQSPQETGLLRLTRKATELISLQEYSEVFKALLEKSDPVAVAPDFERMFTAFKSCPDTTDRALFDQACHAVEGVPATLSTGEGGFDQWKKLARQLTQAMISQRRYDEARMWCVICRLRSPEEPDCLQMHAWCLEEMCSLALTQGEAKVRLHSTTASKGYKLVTVETYADSMQASLRDHLRKIVELCKGSRNNAAVVAHALAGLAASLEKNGQIEEAREVGVEGSRIHFWSDSLQRPSHVCRSLLPGQPWHDAKIMEVAIALEQVAKSIQDEFQKYMSSGKARLVDVGARSGEALLVEKGSWKELALFKNGHLDHEVCMQFPETVRMLTERCADATGLAFCGGGEIAFRVLSPGTKLKRHCGPTNARLTCLFGVSVPLGAEPGVSVGHEAPRPWIDGSCIVFDDSFEHSEELDDMAEGDCVTLLLHFWHPAFEHKNDPDWKQKV